jgi:hypothetical protein
VTVHYATDNRREQRLAVNVPVEIIRYDPQGYMFTERTRIQDITRMGCRFRSQKELQRGDIVLVRPLAASETRLNEGDQNYMRSGGRPRRNGLDRGNPQA